MRILRMDPAYEYAQLARTILCHHRRRCGHKLHLLSWRQLPSVDSEDGSTEILWIAAMARQYLLRITLWSHGSEGRVLFHWLGQNARALSVSPARGQWLAVPVEMRK